MTDNGISKGGCHARRRCQSSSKGNMTIKEIIDEVAPFRACGRNKIRRYMKTLNIQRIGCRQRPDQFPGDSAKKILVHLGLADSPAPNGTNGHAGSADDGKVVSLKKLQVTRAKAKARK